MTASTKSHPNDAAPPSCRSRQTGRYMGCVRIPPSSFRDVREEQRLSCGVEDTGGAHDYNAQQGKSRVAVNLVHFGVDLALCSQPFLVVDTPQRPGAGRIRERCALRTCSPKWSTLSDGIVGGIRGVQDRASPHLRGSTVPYPAERGFRKGLDRTFYPILCVKSSR